MSAESKFKVTTKIRARLLATPTIMAMVDPNDPNDPNNKGVYPLVAPKDTKGDFIIYQRDEYSKAYTQMGIVGQSCKVFVNAVSDDYDRSQELAYQINETLEGRHVTLKMDVKLVDSTEEFADGKYIQVLLFEIK